MAWSVVTAGRAINRTMSSDSVAYSVDANVSGWWSRLPTRFRARFTNVDQAWTKFKFDLDLGLAVICVASTQFRSNHELNSV